MELSNIRCLVSSFLGLSYSTSICFHLFFTISTNSLTVILEDNNGPKFQGFAYSFLSWNNNCPNNKYPERGSKTCCHGLTLLGFLSDNFLFFDIAIAMSLKILSFVQSPPPKTFPALADAIRSLLFFLLVNDFLKLSVTSSAQAFDALYGSWPPNSSFSL